MRILRNPLVSWMSKKKSFLGGTKLVLPPLSSNRKTETATTVSLVEDLSKKLTHHFTSFHQCLNFLTQDYDTNWSGWFQGNGYFPHWITFIPRAPVAAIDSRNTQKRESVRQNDWMVSFCEWPPPSMCSTTKANSTATVINCLHSPEYLYTKK